MDFHTVSSIYMGDDEFGHPVFETKRTELGELLFSLKYRSDNSVIDEIVETTVTFMKNWNPDVNLIVPVPPSRMRRQQPVLTLAEGIGKRLGIPSRPEALALVRNHPEIKNVYDYDERLRLLVGAHTVHASLVGGMRVLLFDDLYRSGATMNSITEALYQQGSAREVFALALTRTRSRL